MPKLFALLLSLLLSAPALAQGIGSRQCVVADQDQILPPASIDADVDFDNGFVAFWMSLQAMSGNARVLRIGTSQGDGSYQFKVWWDNANDRIVLTFVLNGVTKTANIDAAAEDSTWHHYAFAWKTNDYLKTFYDGVEVSSSSGFSSAWAGTISSRRICSGSPGSEQLAGKLAHLQWYAGSIGSSIIENEIGRIMRCPNDGLRSPQNLVIWWPFWEASGNAIDYSKENNNATVANSPDGVVDGPSIPRWCSAGAQ